MTIPIDLTNEYISKLQDTAVSPPVAAVKLEGSKIPSTSIAILTYSLLSTDVPKGKIVSVIMSGHELQNRALLDGERILHRRVGINDLSDVFYMKDGKRSTRDNYDNPSVGGEKKACIHIQVLAEP